MTTNQLDTKIKTRLFPYIKNINKMKDLKIDKESIFYISLREDAELITDFIKYNFPLKLNETFQDLCITDATAGVGGNTISFGKNFKYVNSIEIENTRFKYLQNNIKVYNLKNINTYNEDCLNIIHKLYSDIIFLDPPWGGKDYKYKTNLKLFISDKSIEDICFDIMEKKLTRLIVLKLPLNYDTNNFSNKLFNFKISIKKLNKMLILTLKYQSDN